MTRLSLVPVSGQARAQAAPRRLTATPPRRFGPRTRQKSRPNIRSNSFAPIPPGGSGLSRADRAQVVAWFRDAFARWLRATFKSPEMVAVAFDVRHQTARNWWNGDNTVSGDVLIRVVMGWPDAVAFFRQDWGAQ